MNSGWCHVYPQAMEVVDEEFLRQAKLRMRCGAAVVIMDFFGDRQPQTLPSAIKCQFSSSLSRFSDEASPAPPSNIWTHASKKDSSAGVGACRVG